MKPRWKNILITLTFVGFTLAVLYPIRGMFPPLYYAQYNAVQDRLETIEGLQIRDFWQHEDIVLEDCGFDVSIDDRNASLTFTDHQDWVALFENIDGFRTTVGKGKEKMPLRLQRAQTLFDVCKRRQTTIALQ